MNQLNKFIYSFFVLMLVGLNSIAQDVIEIPDIKSYKLVTTGGSGNGGPTLVTGDNFGRSVASIGDLNNDGINDIVVGANQDNTGGADRGCVYICFMNADGSVASTAQIASGSTLKQPLTDVDYFGVSVAGIGDLNNDGNEDIVVGAYNTDTLGYTNCGSVFVLFLNSSGAVVNKTEITNSESGFPADSLVADALFGSSVANIGDINSDGTNDIAVGSPGISTVQGCVWIIRLNSNGTVKGYKRIKEGQSGLLGNLDPLDAFGISVCGGADLNYDGKNDVVVGASGDDDGYSAAGALWVLYLDTAGTVLDEKKLSYPLMTNYYWPSGSSIMFGESVSLTDINEDGVVDLMAGTRSFNSSEGGFYFMVMDSSQNILEIKNTAFDYNWIFRGPTIAPQFGMSLCEVDLGDVNNKQYIIGANLHNIGGATQQGSFYTLTMDSLKSSYTEGTCLGYTKFSDYSGNFTGTLANSDFFGIDIAAVGDIDSDGNDDLIVGAHGDGSTNVGAAWVLFLDSVGKVSSSSKITSGTTNFVTLSTDHNLGWGICPAGDFDNDGVPDVFVGAPGNDDGGTDRGAVYLLRLNSSGGIKSGGTTKIANGANLTLANSDRFGADIDTIGDVDNNGVVDIVVGAYQNDDGGTNRGAAYVVFLNSDGTVKKSQRISDTQGNFVDTLANSDVFGGSVAGMGDMNGDGIEDIAVGSNMSGTGTVHLITLDTSGNCVTYKKINNAIGNFPHTLVNGQGFGSSLDMITDIDGNGVNDIIIGQYLGKSYNLARGRFWITTLDSLGNVLNAKVLSDSSGNFYTNLNDSYGLGRCIEYAGTDTLGNIKLAFGGTDDDGGADRGGVYLLSVTSISSLPFMLKGGHDKVFYDFNKSLDGGIYEPVDAFLRFKYYEEYRPGTMQFNVYHENQTLLYSHTTIPTYIHNEISGTNQKALGQNYFKLKVGYGGLCLSKGDYILESINDKNEKQYLRFRIKTTPPCFTIH